MSSLKQAHFYSTVLFSCSQLCWWVIGYIFWFKVMFTLSLCPIQCAIKHNLYHYYIVTMVYNTHHNSAVRTWSACCFLCICCFLPVDMSHFRKEKCFDADNRQRNWRWICPRGRPHPQSNPHFIPVSNSGSSGRPIFHGATVGRSEAELLPSKKVPRFFPLLFSPSRVKGKKKKYTFGVNMTFAFLLSKLKIHLQRNTNGGHTKNIEQKSCRTSNMHGYGMIYKKELSYKHFSLPKWNSGPCHGTKQ